MNKLFLNIITLLFMFILLNCSEDKNPIGSEDNNFIYPLKIGNRWEYTREILVYFRADTSQVTAVDDTISSISTIQIVRTETLTGFIRTYVFNESLVGEEGCSFESESYYNNQEDGFYLYAYRGPGYIIPKSSVQKRIYFKGRYFRDIREIISFIEKAIPNKYTRSDSLIYEDPPLKSLPYPLEIGKQWVYREVGNPWRIDKKVLGKENVTVPAGEFNCYKIQWLIDLDDNGEWENDMEFFDYICTKGLIRRHILFKDLGWTDEEGNQIGKFDVEEDSQLSSVHLK